MCALKDFLWLNDQGLSTLSNLNVHQPFTYVETFSSPAPDCATDPATITEWRTAFVTDNTFYALATSYTLRVATETFYVTYVYPGLILSMLKPGDVIYQVVRKSHSKSVPPLTTL